MAQPPEVEALSAELRAAYRTAWEEITAEQARLADDATAFRRRARLRELQAMVEDRTATLDEQARVWLSQDYPAVYRMGAEAAAGVLDEPFRWTTPDQSAINLLAQDAFEDLLAATANVRDSTKALIRAVARDRALVGRIVGETAQQSARRVARELRRRGITAVVYADGSRHGLAEYSEMVLRTKTAVAYSAGGLNVGQRAGVRFFEVLDGPGCGWTSHDDPDKANGTIRSIEECATAVIAHPNCQRSLSPRPDVTDPELAEPSVRAS
jgi:hypothetical protein